MAEIPGLRLTPYPGYKLYQQYAELAKKEKDVIFGGRLGQYKYYDMDKVIRAALTAVEEEDGR